jgi:hypothetical protein
MDGHHVQSAVILAYALLPQCRLTPDETLLAVVNDLTKTCVAAYKRSLTHMANIKASTPSHLSQDEIAYDAYVLASITFGSR